MKHYYFHLLLALIFMSCMTKLSATTTYYGENQLEKVLEKIDNKSSLTGSSSPQTVEGASWKYVPSGFYDYYYLDSIKWGSKSLNQTVDTKILLQHDGASDANNLSTLSKLDFSGNNFLNMEITNAPALKTILLQNNQNLEKLSIVNNPALTYLDVSGCRLPFSELYPLKQLNITTFKYDNQNIQKKSYIFYNVDLSKEFNLGTSTTDISWTGSIQPIALNPTSHIYEFNQSDEGKTATCTLTNTAFPGLSIEYEIVLTPYYVTFLDRIGNINDLLQDQETINLHGFVSNPSDVASWKWTLGGSRDRKSTGSPISSKNER